MTRRAGVTRRFILIVHSWKLLLMLMAIRYDVMSHQDPLGPAGLSSFDVVSPNETNKGRISVDVTDYSISLKTSHRDAVRAKSGSGSDSSRPGIVTVATPINQELVVPGVLYPVVSEHPCPEGFRRSADRCVRVIQLDPTASCPQGSVYNKGRCEKTEIIPAQYICAEEYTLSHSAAGIVECVFEDIAAPILECETGFIMEGDQCIKRINAGSPDAVCPESIPVQRGRRCELYDSLPAVPRCRRETFLEGNRCIRVSDQPAIKFCEQGYVLNDSGRCEKILKGPKINSSNAAADPGMLAGLGQSTIQLVEREANNPSISTSSNKKLRRGINNDKLQMICEQGPDGESPAFLSPNGKKCIRIERTSPIRRCGKNFIESIDTGQCIKRQVKPAIKTCARGYQRVHNHCVLVLDLEPQYFCDSNMKLRGRDCEELETVSAVSNCSAKLLHNGLCVEQEFIPPKLSCPANQYTLEHIESQPRLACVSKHYTPVVSLL